MSGVWKRGKDYCRRLLAPLHELAAQKSPRWSSLAEEIDRHYSEYPILPAQLPENIERLETLERDGIVFIKGLLDAEALAKLKADLFDEINAIKTQKSEAPTDCQAFYPELGRYRLYQVDRRVPATHALRDHPVIRDLVRAYMSNCEHFHDLTLEMRESPPDWDRALGDLNAHCDHIFREIKVYIALEDITDDNGPIIYWTGTHRDGEWRRLPDYLTSIGGVWGESHILNHQTMASLMIRSPEFAACRAVRAKITAGSAFVADMRGVHRATYLNRGERWHLYLDFGFKGKVRQGVPHNDRWLQPLDLA